MITKIEKYGANWCNPCKLLDKTLEQLPKEIELIKHDVEEEPELTEQKRIRNIPVLIFYDNDTEVTRTVGAISTERLFSIIDN